MKKNLKRFKALCDWHSHYLEVHSPVLIRDMQQQVTQHLLLSKLIDDQKRPRRVVLDSVVKVAGPVHGGNNNGGEIGVTFGTFLPDRAMHAGEGEEGSPDYVSVMSAEGRVI